jgi:hypothetical protein
MSRPLLSLNQSIATLESNRLTVRVDAFHGARITALNFMGVELLLQRSAHPTNFGSTLWDAPQSRWHWPPPPTLDSEPYETCVTSDELQFKSAVDEESQLQFSKSIRAMEASDAIAITYGITNHAADSISVAAWEVTRVPPGITFLPATRISPRATSNLPGVMFASSCAWYQPEAATLELGKKAFFDGAAGWLAHVFPQRIMLLKSFTLLTEELYSPGHAAIEVYGHEQAAYVELENMGARTLLAPGDSLRYQVEWRVALLSDDVPLTAGSTLLVDFAHALDRRDKS